MGQQALFEQFKEKVNAYWSIFADGGQVFTPTDHHESQSLELELLALRNKEGDSNVFNDMNCFFYVMDLIENNFSIQLYDTDTMFVEGPTNNPGNKNRNSNNKAFNKHINGRKGLLSLFRDITY